MGPRDLQNIESAGNNSPETSLEKNDEIQARFRDFARDIKFSADNASRATREDHQFFPETALRGRNTKVNMVKGKRREQEGGKEQGGGREQGRSTRRVVSRGVWTHGGQSLVLCKFGAACPFTRLDHVLLLTPAALAFRSFPRARYNKRGQVIVRREQEGNLGQLIADSSSCDTPGTCSVAWSREWEGRVRQLMHHASQPIRCLDLLDQLRNTHIPGLCNDCQDLTVTWLWGVPSFIREERLVDEAVEELKLLQAEKPLRAALRASIDTLHQSVGLSTT
ncbi:hypothetical protein C8F04DRAFT_1184647 [Mycena alexandri]|uniref:Uncharacterized protein n=1 Tax=Mycena alexandri TaxID=1745969 RepID=A0AAD6SSN1_9AGAR|nr:hypothetical protein C8F04DRAFT_1184647 [Mycena alexandri]